MIDNAMDRTKFIGGSDIAVIMQLSKWKTPLQLWAEKTGKIIPKDLSKNEAVEWGIELEDILARKFEKQTGFKVRCDNRTFVHPKYSYMVGHIDRWIVGEDAFLECKTTSAYLEKDWRGEEMPAAYIAQVNWYCGLIPKRLGYVTCLIGGQKRVGKRLEFDEELFEKQVAMAQNFWENHVLKDIPPTATADDSETLNMLYPDSNESTVHFDGEAGDRLNALIEERQGGIEQSKMIEEEVEKLSNQIKQCLGESTYGQTNTYSLSWKAQTRTTADSEKMKLDGIFEKYAKTSTFKVLRTKLLKGASS